MSTDLALAPAPTWLPEPGGGRWVVADRPETWRPIPDWEGWYEASDKGRVRSLDRIVIRRDGVQYRARGKILRSPLQKGYPRVDLRRPGVRVTVAVHALVMAAFARPPLPGEECRHGPRGPLFNWWPEDLCWGTRVENKADELRDGTRNRGERHGNAKLTEADIRRIRARRAAHEPRATIAADYGIDPATVGGIYHRRRWAHVA